MFCSQCGNKLTSDARFCQNCGTQVGSETASPVKIVEKDAVRPVVTEAQPVIAKAGMSCPSSYKMEQSAA